MHIREADMESLMNDFSDYKLLDKEIPFDTFSYINLNNMYDMESKTEHMQGIGIQDKDYPIG